MSETRYTIDDLIRGVKEQQAEIDRLRRILATLRRPNVVVVDAATEAFAYWDDMSRALSAAVAAAEQEVGP